MWWTIIFGLARSGLRNKFFVSLDFISVFLKIEKIHWRLAACRLRFNPDRAACGEVSLFEDHVERELAVLTISAKAVKRLDEFLTVSDTL